MKNSFLITLFTKMENFHKKLIAWNIIEVIVKCLLILLTETLLENSVINSLNYGLFILQNNFYYTIITYTFSITIWIATIILIAKLVLNYDKELTVRKTMSLYILMRFWSILLPLININYIMAFICIPDNNTEDQNADLSISIVNSNWKCKSVEHAIFSIFIVIIPFILATIYLSIFKIIQTLHKYSFFEHRYINLFWFEVFSDHIYTIYVIYTITVNYQFGKVVEINTSKVERSVWLSLIWLTEHIKLQNYKNCYKSYFILNIPSILAFYILTFQINNSISFQESIFIIVLYAFITIGVGLKGYSTRTANMFNIFKRFFIKNKICTLQQELYLKRKILVHRSYCVIDNCFCRHSDCNIYLSPSNYLDEDNNRTQINNYLKNRIHFEFLYYMLGILCEKHNIYWLMFYQIVKNNISKFTINSGYKFIIQNPSKSKIKTFSVNCFKKLYQEEANKIDIKNKASVSDYRFYIRRYNIEILLIEWIIQVIYFFKLYYLASSSQQLEENFYKIIESANLVDETFSHMRKDMKIDYSQNLDGITDEENRNIIKGVYFFELFFNSVYKNSNSHLSTLGLQLLNRRNSLDNQNTEKVFIIFKHGSKHAIFKCGFFKDLDIDYYNLDEILPSAYKRMHNNYIMKCQASNMNIYQLYAPQEDTIFFLEDKFKNMRLVKFTKINFLDPNLEANKLVSLTAIEKPDESYIIVNQDNEIINKKVIEAIGKQEEIIKSDNYKILIDFLNKIDLSKYKHMSKADFYKNLICYKNLVLYFILENGFIDIIPSSNKIVFVTIKNILRTEEDKLYIVTIKNKTTQDFIMYRINLLKTFETVSNNIGLDIDTKELCKDMLIKFYSELPKEIGIELLRNFCQELTINKNDTNNKMVCAVKMFNSALNKNTSKTITNQKINFMEIDREKEIQAIVLNNKKISVRDKDEKNEAELFYKKYFAITIVVEILILLLASISINYYDNKIYSNIKLLKNGYRTMINGYYFSLDNAERCYIQLINPEITHLGNIYESFSNSLPYIRNLSSFRFELDSFKYSDIIQDKIKGELGYNFTELYVNLKSIIINLRQLINNCRINEDKFVQEDGIITIKRNEDILLGRFSEFAQYMHTLIVTLDEIDIYATKELSHYKALIISIGILTMIFILGSSVINILIHIRITNLQQKIVNELFIYSSERKNNLFKNLSKIYYLICEVIKKQTEDEYLNPQCNIIDDKNHSNIQLSKVKKSLRKKIIPNILLSLLLLIFFIAMISIKFLKINELNDLYKAHFISSKLGVMSLTSQNLLRDYFISGEKILFDEKTNVKLFFDSLDRLNSLNDEFLESNKIFSEKFRSRNVINTIQMDDEISVETIFSNTFNNQYDQLWSANRMNLEKTFYCIKEQRELNNIQYPFSNCQLANDLITNYSTIITEIYNFLINYFEERIDEEKLTNKIIITIGLLIVGILFVFLNISRVTYLKTIIMNTKFIYQCKKIEFLFTSKKMNHLLGYFTYNNAFD